MRRVVDCEIILIFFLEAEEVRLLRLSRMVWVRRNRMTTSREDQPVRRTQ